MNTNPKIGFSVFLLLLGSVFVVSAFIVSLFNPFFSKKEPMLAEGIVTKVEGFYTYYTFELEGVKYENRALGREPHCAGEGDTIPVKYLGTTPPHKNIPNFYSFICFKELILIYTGLTLYFLALMGKLHSCIDSIPDGSRVCMFLGLMLSTLMIMTIDSFTTPEVIKEENRERAVATVIYNENAHTECEFCDSCGKRRVAYVPVRDNCIVPVGAKIMVDYNRFHPHECYISYYYIYNKLPYAMLVPEIGLILSCFWGAALPFFKKHFSFG